MESNTIRPADLPNPWSQSSPARAAQLDPRKEQAGCLKGTGGRGVGQRTELEPCIGFIDVQALLSSVSHLHQRLLLGGVISWGAHGCPAQVGQERSLGAVGYGEGGPLLSGRRL